MKIKATLIGFGAALALAAGLAGLSGTAAADPKQPVPAAAPSAAPAAVPSAAPADHRPTAQPTPSPKEPAVVKPAYTG
ncbi:hypothetical protein HTZ77_20145 [Nonomuraea sp. SMC257]|uniref:Uncharacterized protein n=1 Tax=Nonomuraea montanisoli TaxID=2741721 RepID=A0A7Y6I9Q9_9ACTN|nr:hypothetical protein [Nonomuraea montanisoli]NUW33728.1 hypothetical protein [Nonomuraea montanisoli]